MTFDGRCVDNNHLLLLRRLHLLLWLRRSSSLCLFSHDSDWFGDDDSDHWFGDDVNSFLGLGLGLLLLL